MRAAAEYGFGEWAKAVPLVHGFKRVRNIAVDRAFRRIPARGFDRFMNELAGQRTEAIAIVIAYNTPWVIDIATRITRKNLAGTLVVCDNSRSRDARGEIERICCERGVAYLGLPFNPDWNPCRSHGIALNWAYYNIVEAVRPKVFAILDHDLFPLARLDIAARVSDQPVYGAINPKPWGWGLWAGYCMFDRAAIADLAPDFNNDLPRQLDTGGRNWTQIYRHLDRARIRFASTTSVSLRCSGPSPVRVYMVDDCLHVGGASYASGFTARTQRAFFEAVVDHIENGGALSDLVVAPPEENAEAA